MADYDKDMAEERIQIKDDKQKIYQDDKEKRDTNAKMYPKKEEGPKTFEGGAHRGEMKHGKDGSHQGPKMYGGEDKGPKMTSDPQSYRSSMSKHWHQSNLLSENPIVNHATEK